MGFYGMLLFNIFIYQKFIGK